MIRCGGGTRRYRESRLGKGLGLLPRSLKRWPPCLRRSGFAQAGLKLLQPVPLCPALDVLIARDLCSGIRSIFARDRGGSPKRLHRPNRFRVWLRELGGGGEWIFMSTALIRVTLNAGLMKPRRGFTLVAGEENWGWASECL